MVLEFPQNGLEIINTIHWPSLSFTVTVEAKLRPLKKITVKTFENFEIIPS